MEYDKIEQRISEDSYSVLFIAKERKCDICSKVQKRKNIDVIKYPIIHETMGRLIMTKKVCNDCIDEVKEVLDNLKYN